MKVVERHGYKLLLGNNPSEVFKFFGVNEMHGLSLKDSQSYPTTKDDAYIAGLCNFIPNTDERFVYLNTSRWSYGLVFHEMMHQSFFKHDYDINKEESIITWAEVEANDIYETYKMK